MSLASHVHVAPSADMKSQKSKLHLSSLTELTVVRSTGLATISPIPLWHFLLVRGFEKECVGAGPNTKSACHLVEPWDMGTIQATVFAKSWSGKARLPSVARMWEEYPGAGKEVSNFDSDSTAAIGHLFHLVHLLHLLTSPGLADTNFLLNSWKPSSSSMKVQIVLYV